MSAAVQDALGELVASVGKDNGALAKHLRTILQSLRSDVVCSEVVTAPWGGSLVHALVHQVMNNRTLPRSARFEALACLLSLSRVPDDDFRERLMLPQLTRLEQGFEDLLSDNQQHQAENGFGLGRQHEQVVVLLLRCTGFRLTSSDLLHLFCDNDVTFLLHLLVSVLSRPFYDSETHHAVLRCIYELTLPQTYFGSSPSLCEHHFAQFERHINAMIDVAMRTGLVHAVASALPNLMGDNKSQSKYSRWASSAQCFSMMHLNLLRFTNDAKRATAWRQMLLVAEPALFTTFFLPHLAGASCWLAEQLRSVPPAADQRELSALATALSSCLRLLCVASFEHSASHAAVMHELRRLLVETSRAVLDFPPFFTKAHLPLLAHLLQCHANMDTLFVAGERNGEAAAEERDASSPDPSRLLLLHEMKTCFSTLQASRVNALAGASSCLDLLLNIVRSPAEIAFVAHHTATFGAIVQLAQQVREQSLAEQRDVGGGLQKSGAMAGGSDELTDDYLDEMAAQLDEQIKELEHAVGDARTSIGILSKMSPEKLSRSSDNASCLSMLGDLPALPKVHAREGLASSVKKRNQTGSVASQRTLVGAIPEEFLCGLTRQLMQHPVRLPNGRVYELAVLERSVETVGHVDPVTGEALDFELDVDPGLQRQILAFTMRRCLESDGGIVF